MEYLLTLSEPVVRRKLRPSQVLICVHPAWLIGSPTDDPPASISLTGPILQRKWNVVGERLAWWNWFSNNRPFVDDKALMAIHSARVGLDTFPESDPWRQVERLGYPYHETASALRTQMEGLERRGWFDPRQYARYEAKQAKVLGDVAAGFQALGSDCAKHAVRLVQRACYVEPTSPLFNSRLVAFVHDELIAETDDGPGMHDAAYEMCRLMAMGAN